LPTVDNVEIAYDWLQAVVYQPVIGRVTVCSTNGGPDGTRSQGTCLRSTAEADDIS